MTNNGTWKLASFECAQKIENNRHWVQSDFVKNVKEENFSPPEDKVNKDQGGNGILLANFVQRHPSYCERCVWVR